MTHSRVPLGCFTVGILAAMVVGFATGACEAATLCPYRDYMPDYAKFAADTQALSPEARADAFVKRFAAAHPDFYLSTMFSDAAKQKARARRYFDPRQRRRFAGFPPLTDARMLAFAKIVGPQFLAEQKRFADNFPDFSCGTEVEFAPSLMVFDGHAERVKGRKYLLFGVDAIAMIHSPDDLPAFFDHELFHLYHFQVLRGPEPKGGDPTWWSMWVEGLATYVSQRMNPTNDAQRLLIFPTDMVARMKTQERRGARLLLGDIDKTGADAGRWFDSARSVEGLPQRVGYYYGYQFAKSVGEGKKLPALARMTPQEVHIQAVAFLKRLASGGAK